MKRLIFLLSFVTLISCDKDRAPNNNNPFIPNYSFTIDINTALPSYSQLQFVSNPIFIQQQGIGFKGIIVMKVGENAYSAFEATCPNQIPSACSQLTINGINAVCPCDNTEYSLFTGLGNSAYPLKPYRVEVIGAIIRVYN